MRNLPLNRPLALLLCLDKASLAFDPMLFVLGKEKDPDLEGGSIDPIESASSFSSSALTELRAPNTEGTEAVNDCSSSQGGDKLSDLQKQNTVITSFHVVNLYFI